MAKSPKTTDAPAPAEVTEPVDATTVAEAPVIPAPLVEAVQETDSVYQAHLIRQANHFDDLAPSIAKQAREDLEREASLNEAGKIQAEWAAHIAAEQKKQAEREEREGAAARITFLEEEIANTEAGLADKRAEVDRLKKLVA